MDQLPQSSQKDIWTDARDKAVEANKQAKESKEIMQPILEDLSNGVSNAKQLSKKIDDTNLDITQATLHIDRVTKLLPNLQLLVDKLKSKQEESQVNGNNLADRIERLKKQIEIAREMANSIKVGVQFHPNTTLELQTPSNIAQFASDFKTSVYFRTNKTNGVLLYLGNENKRDGKNYVGQDDYMALQIENGYPILLIDVGTGPEKVINNKNVANGKWYQAIVERVGNVVTLDIREEIENGDRVHGAEGKLMEGSNLFDLNRENSKLFVGGFPPEFNQHQDPYGSGSFEGEIEDLRIGDEKVGLWNFVDAQNNKDGARERNQLVASEKEPTGYRFNGHGYVILDAKPYNFKHRSNIHFQFKASKGVTDGLMFYAGKNNHFISVEMKNGGVVYQYKLGQHHVSIGSTTQYNDDQWHAVEAERNGRQGVLKIDGQEINQDESPVGSEEVLKISDNLYFGGHPNEINHTEVTSQNFDGCIDHVYISGTLINLSQNLKAYDVRPGCASKFSDVLSFAPRQFGYLRHNISAPLGLHMNLKFKTKQSQGVIFYATDATQENAIGLFLEDGSLVLRSQNVEINSHPTKYNNSEWHHLELSHDDNAMRLTVDGSNELVSSPTSRPLKIEDGDIYFGGLPNNFEFSPEALRSPAYFVGCISDAYISGPIVNFAESPDRKSVLLDNCARDILGKMVSKFKTSTNMTG